MTLTEEQTAELKKWLANGEKLSNVQTMLSEKFGINMTYMELRFLIDDIGAEIVDKPDEKPEEKIISKEAQEPVAPPESVQVSLSPIQRPGAIASGSVVFSDGTKAEWILDQTGRLGLNGTPEGFKPPEADLPEFQRKLQELIMGR